MNCLKVLLKKTNKSRIAKTLLCLMSFQIMAPLRSMALTAGPTQPEMQSFEPVGTTDLVDHFTGNFDYNIPLLDVEGYPINIAYHSGITMEQEASWVGLGWNINPGNINHMVRGVSDDYNGDFIDKKININPEVKKGFGVSGGMEVFGFLDAGTSLGMNFSNYTGVSASVGYTSGMKIPKGSGGGSSISGGINMGLTASTSDGADFDYGLSLGASSHATKAMTASVTGNFGQAFNSRQGLMNTSFGVSGSLSTTTEGENKPKSAKRLAKEQARGKIVKAKEPPQGHASSTMNEFNYSSTPIGLSNYVPVITNASHMVGYSFQCKVGGELYGMYFNGNIAVNRDVIEVMPNGGKKAYGYFNLQNAQKEDMVDFTRDKDGRIHRKMTHIPPANMTYDIYNVNGQGTSGNYRGFRNDIGPVYDPYITSENENLSVRVEIGASNLVEVGSDFSYTSTASNSGPWQSFDNKSKRAYKSKQINKKFEPSYMKQAGELTFTNSELQTALPPNEVLTPNPIVSLPSGVGMTTFKLANINNSFVNENKRQTRANLMYYLNGSEASDRNKSLMPTIESYSDAGNILDKDPPIYRNVGYRKGHLISEITQLTPDGSRYVYGIPAMNISQEEYVFTLKPKNDVYSSLGVNKIGGKAEAHTNWKTAGEMTDADLGQNFHMSTHTPAHAHSYLLTSVLSADYSDLTGDGITDDDLGNFTKFNYTLKSANYKWRTPYSLESASNPNAKLDIGVRSDGHDDKGVIVEGTKEIWMLHSIESKNYVAEFHTSPRVDGASINGVPSFKLDKIVLYSKNDRIQVTQNGSNITKTINPNAKAIKEIIFTYDYSLCTGVPNVLSATSGTPGKLTLKAISIRNGQSDIGLLSPYKFDYGDIYPNTTGSKINPQYNEEASDVWGEYKEKNAVKMSEMTNHEFPYVDQDNPNLDRDARAWNLSKITLPSGGTIQVEYEADDYAYVQDKEAMEMFEVKGVGTGAAFNESNILYTDKNNPSLYLYFKRKTNELYTGTVADLEKTYLKGAQSILFNFEVKINGGTTESCPNVPLTDNVKGYADVEAIGVCSGANSPYGYIKIKPKWADVKGKFVNPSPNNSHRKYQLNPITVSAIHYAQYYNNKAIFPASEIVSPNVVDIIQQLGASVKEFSNFVRSPMLKFLNDGLAREFNKGRSYIRLNSQGKKKGGGHRVKSLIYSDAWNEMVGGQNVATFGSTYDYTTVNEDGKLISSGVASYEPLGGGDENPLRTRLASDKIGNESRFPMVDPIELVVEAPIGESLYPPASVGYSKVTVKSIHKTVGENSNLLQVYDHYTAKDFPISVIATPLEKIEDKYPKKINFQRIKQDKYRVAQAYLITLNDMHGKLKRQTTLLDNGAGSPAEIAYTAYNYNTSVNSNTNKTDLNNTVKCINMNATSSSINVIDATLGMEEDFTYDIREKNENTRVWGLNINLNTFMVGPIPIPLPTPIVKPPKGMDKVFSSVVGTKIVQKYGILKSVESFDKGAKVVVENLIYDGLTGQVVVTRVNTEHNDFQDNIKTPAYWAYNGMGHGYENIHYEESINNNASIVNDTMFIYGNAENGNLKNYKIGDEITVDISSSCMTNDNPVTESYKLWVVGKTNAKTPNVKENVWQKCHYQPACTNYTNQYSTPNSNPNGFSLNDALIYKMNQVCGFSQNEINAGYPSDQHHQACGYLDELNCALRYFVRDPALCNYVNNIPPEYVEFTNLHTTEPVVPLNQYQNIANSQYQVFPSGGTQGQAISPIYYHFARNTHFHQAVPPAFNPNNDPGTTRYELGTTYKAELKNLQAYPTGAPVVFNSTDVLKVEYQIKYSNDFYSFKKPLPAPITSSPNYLSFSLLEPLEFLQSFNCTEDIDINPFINLPTTTYLGSAINNYLVTKVELYFPYNGTQLPSQVIPQYKYLTETNMGHLSLINLPWQPDFSLEKIAGNNVGAYSIMRVNKYDIERVSATVIPRSAIPSTYNDKSALICLPMKRGVISTTGTNAVFPSNDTIYSAKVKVIRSGGKNMLTETAQELTTVAKPGTTYSSLNYSNLSNLIAISATEYTDEVALPEALNDPNSIYFNQYVTGGKGVYRPYKMYVNHRDRNYGNNNLIDKDKGFYNGDSFWKLVTAQNNSIDDPYFRLEPLPLPNNSGWYAKTEISKYNPWGNDQEITDASGNIHCNIFGYGNKLPIAIVSNSESDNSLNENFEDYGDRYNYFIRNTNTPLPFEFKYYPSPIRSLIKSQTPSSDFSFSSTAHSGSKSLEVINDKDIDVPIINTMTYNFERPTIWPFHFRNQKYIFSYWQHVSQNTGIPINGGISLTYNNATFYAKPKTPNIDGWVLFEGAIDIVASSATTAKIKFKNGTKVDDFRLMPNSSNMKAYVYHPVTQKLAAVLDENNAATFFEYTPEGKLARIKKETEKGRLTLKESRESLKNLLAPPPGSVSTTLVDPAALFQAPIPILNNY